MKVEIKDRIKQALEIREITQSELAEKANIDKGQLSSYISGKYKPRQNNVNALSLALNVDEAWLMGFDVPMERNNHESPNLPTFETILNEAIKFIELSGYNVAFSTDTKSDIIVTNDKKEILFIGNSHSLVGRYLAIKNNKNFSAEDLWLDSEYEIILDKIHAFDCQLKILGWTYKIMIDGNPKTDKQPAIYALFNKGNISFKVSGDDYNRLVNDSLDFMEKRIQKLFHTYSAELFDNSYTIAAHAHTDIEASPEDTQHDLDNMGG